MSVRAIPELNRAMVLETRALTPDGGGGHVDGWVALGTLWAAVERPAARLVADGAREVPALRVRIIVRAAPAGQARRPVPGQRLRQDDRLFHIKAVSEYDAKGRFLQLWAEEAQS
ncbi:head-tail adaptor protein [Pontivivens insulae]|uniref:Phage head-tail joining protein n=1 Tax=Pontivivens insulae TaxID=1639689 RepID=A0A2R8AAB9_9RHOB|nr:head-tail adaptor protein [Pontivivens insulae]RED13082.1 head-tail adaptor [Pontivivens insulae]SPF29174.1 hypothetical protein POI8812_01481 [Pontivivens insulae]